MTPLYEFFRDQGSLIGGVLALIGGLALYVIGHRQVKATMNTGLLDELHEINEQAVSLRDEAADGMKRCTAVLAETQSADFL